MFDEQIQQLFFYFRISEGHNEGCTQLQDGHEEATKPSLPKKAGVELREGRKDADKDWGSVEEIAPPPSSSCHSSF